MFDHNDRNKIIEYPGVAQMVERVVWDHEAAGSKPVTRTKNPLKSAISEDFCYFFVYCSAVFCSPVSSFTLRFSLSILPRTSEIIFSNFASHSSFVFA